MAGVAFGALLAVTDSGHLPAVLAPVVLGLIGCLGGLVGGLLYGAIARRKAFRRWQTILLGCLCGAAVGAASYPLGLGIPLVYVAFTGALLGAISALVHQAWQ